MESNKVDMFMIANSKYFESHHLNAIREKLLQLDDSKWPVVQTMQFKSPDTTQLLSIMGGQLGMDRFFIGDTGLGIAKLLTCGGFYIWTIIDWFSISSAAREKNMETFQNSLY
ncbi:TM2 domain-containing protein [Flavobacterium sp.]|uniref:TM2 domain-containing protein n=1 Tax=Flavobacterium sp. TaxID=239 RepID=UPI0037504974